MVKSFKIIILNPAKGGRIKELRKIDGCQGFKVSMLKERYLGSDVWSDVLKFDLTTTNSQKTIKRTDVDIFIQLMLKGKGCTLDDDYALEIEE